jgi:replication factor C large subunit
MEKQKAQMRVEERDKRFEELQNQMMAIPEEIVEEPQEEALPFEIDGINEEPSVEEAPVEEEPKEEVIEEPKKEDKEEKSKKKTDKQVSLFSF